MIATKAGAAPRLRPPRDGSRGHLLRALDALAAPARHRLRRPVAGARLRPDTPLEETLSALDIAVTSGRARYVGVSNYCRLADRQGRHLAAGLPGPRPLVSTQVEYSLLERGIEREVLPAALAWGSGCCPGRRWAAAC